MKREARVRKEAIPAMELGAFDDLLVSLDINALHNRIQEAYQRKQERVKAKRSQIREDRESGITG
jgi:DNA-binding NtrC family response regulator